MRPLVLVTGAGEQVTATVVNAKGGKRTFTTTREILEEGLKLLARIDDNGPQLRLLPEPGGAS